MVRSLYPMLSVATGHLGRLGGTRLARARGTDEAARYTWNESDPVTAERPSYRYTGRSPAFLTASPFYPPAVLTGLFTVVHVPVLRPWGKNRLGNLPDAR